LPGHGDAGKGVFLFMEGVMDWVLMTEAVPKRDDVYLVAWDDGHWNAARWAGGYDGGTWFDTERAPDCCGHHSFMGVKWWAVVVTWGRCDDCHKVTREKTVLAK